MLSFWLLLSFLSIYKSEAELQNSEAAVAVPSVLTASSTRVHLLSTIRAGSTESLLELDKCSTQPPNSGKEILPFPIQETNLEL